MNQHGPIIIIEDDPDDQYILSEIFRDLSYPNEIIFIGDSTQALAYLTVTEKEPFLVISDINMPILNGIELREKIHENLALRRKYIPYIFLSTGAEKGDINDAYATAVHGYFVKPGGYVKMKALIVKIVEYWQASQSPHSATKGRI